MRFPEQTRELQESMWQKKQVMIVFNLTLQIRAHFFLIFAFICTSDIELHLLQYNQVRLQLKCIQYMAFLTFQDEEDGFCSYEPHLTTLLPVLSYNLQSI